MSEQRDDDHPDRRATIPPRLEALLVDSLEPEPNVKLDAIDAATIRERVLNRVRASKGLTTIQADEGVWESFSPKVRIKVLHRDVNTQSYLLRLEPGAASSSSPGTPSFLDRKSVV